MGKPIIPISFTNHFNTGCRLLSEGNKERAESFFQRAAEVCPEAWLGLACESLAADDKEEALRRFFQVFNATDKPMLKSIVANNIGTILSDKGHSMEAAPYFSLSYKLWKNADALANLALLAKYNGRIDEAKRLVDKSLRMNPRQHQAWFTRALICLVSGEYSEGFRDYESRWKNPKSDLEKLPVMRPEWTGVEPLAGKTVLVYSEQGAGDTIQMLRYAPLLKDRGARVLIAPQSGLGSICERMACFDGIHEDIKARIAKGNVPAYDYQIPAMSLPRAFRTTLRTIPAPVRFKVHPIAHDASRLNIGIAWAGSAAHQHDKWRSTSLLDWTPLWSLPVNWHSLQVGPRSIDIIGHDAPVVDMTSTFKDFATTADYIAGLDLVICVDTSVAHLAGTIGKPVWLVNAFMPDWRWMLHRSDSPWYPSVRQFRQVQPLDWRWVFDDIRRELSNLCSSHQTRN